MKSAAKLKLDSKKRFATTKAVLIKSMRATLQEKISYCEKRKSETIYKNNS